MRFVRVFQAKSQESCTSHVRSLFLSYDALREMNGLPDKQRIDEDVKERSGVIYL